MKNYRKLAKQGRSDFAFTIASAPPNDFVRPTDFLDDEQLVFDGTWDMTMRVIYGIPVLAFTVIWIWNTFEGGGFFEELSFGVSIFLDIMSYLTLSVVFGVIGACLAVLAYIIINPSRKIIFNRLEGTVTLPAYKRRWLSKKTVTQPFTGTRFTTGHLRNSFMMCIGILGTMDTFSFLGSEYSRWAKVRDFSAIVWYMDKNRPLPPGKKLDPYREKDYNRRKAEGFPAPLFHSNIDTPEWEGAEKK
jgi:hypothetical protein